MQCKPLERDFQGLHHSAPPGAAGESSSCSTSTPTLAAVGFSHPNCSGGRAAHPSFLIPSSGPTRGAEDLCAADEDAQLCEVKRFAHSPSTPARARGCLTSARQVIPFSVGLPPATWRPWAPAWGGGPSLGPQPVCFVGATGRGPGLAWVPPSYPEGAQKTGGWTTATNGAQGGETQRRGGESVLRSTWGRSPPCSERPGPGWGGGGRRTLLEGIG